MLRLPTLVSNSAGFSFATSSFVALAQVAWLAGGMEAWLAVAAAGVLVLLVAGVFGELSGMYPSASALRAYLRAGYGDPFALSVAMVYAFVMVAVLGTEAYVLARAVAVVLPGPVPDLALGALLAVSTALNLRGAEASARFQNVVTVAMLASAWALAIVALRGPAPAWAPASPPGSFPRAMAAAVYLFVGFEWVTPRAEEAKSAGSVARGMGLAVLLLTATFGLLAAAFGHGLPPSALAGSSPQITLALRLGRGPWTGWMLAVCLAASATTFNAGIGSASRLLFGLGRERALPAGLAIISRSSGVPARATWVTLGAALAVAALVAAIHGFAGLVDMAAAAESAVYGLAAVAVLRLRRRDPNAPRPHRAWGGVWVIGGVGAAFTGLAGLAALDGGPAVPLCLGAVWMLAYAAAARVRS